MLLAAAALLLSGCGSGELAPVAGGWGVETGPIAVGTEEYFGLPTLQVTGSEPVHILAVQVPDVPSGLRIAGTYAVSLTESGNGESGDYLTNAAADFMRQHEPRFRVHPVTDAVLRPGPEYSDWYLLIDAVPTRAGSFAITALRVLYESGGSFHTANFGGWRLVVNCSRTAA